MTAKTKPAAKTKRPIPAPKMVDKLVQVSTYRRREPSTASVSYGIGSATTEPAIRWQFNMQDLATRIDVLQKARMPVRISVDENWIALSTIVKEPAPAPPKPETQPNTKRRAKKA